ncbi:MAG: DUF1707 domain-containing protein [Jiangellaceae bacterium]|nr:DUF1707 domain-containing protein [Jiangellaceae bacterium]
MAERAEMRASDADRDRVAEVLRDAHAEGRLSQDELLERLGAAYEARTYAELDRLVADLPRPARAPAPRLPSTPAPRPVPPQVHHGLWRPLQVGWWIWGMVVSVNVVIWLLVSISSGDLQHFWPIWVAGPWGAVLLGLTMVNRSIGRGPR